MRNCVKCSSLTNYICLKCAKPVCNKSKACSSPADEDSLGWKAGVSVAYCVSCSDVPTPKVAKQARIPVKDSKPVTKKFTAKKPPMPPQANDGQRKCLSLKEKIEVIRKSNEGNSMRKLAKIFDCGKTQIVKILKQKAKILESWNSNEGAQSQKRLNVEKYGEINGLLWKWYTRARESNIPVDGPMLVEEARIIAERIGDDTFKGTSGWLDKWKKRHNIGQMNISGEEGDVSQETIDSWNERLKELTRGYSPRDIWNEDETGCFWKATPQKSLSQKGKRCRGGKNAKQRITAAFFVNAAGDKEALIVIGSSRRPRCFARLANPSYPCGAQYFSNEKAWMRTEIMVTILTRLNNRLKREERHIILFLDNAPCHPPSLTDMFSNIKVAFLPKNTTSRTQPLDAGIIKVWKIYYKRKLLRHIVSQVDGEHSASEIVKSVNLLMAVRWMVNAWDEVKCEVISKCFRHVGMYPSAMDLDEDDDDPFAGEELLDLEALVQKMSKKGIDAAPYAAFDDDADAYYSLDPADPDWRETLRDEVITTHSNRNKTEIATDSDSDDSSDDAPLPIPAVQTVKGALDLVRQIAEFAHYRSCEELSTAVTKVSDILVDMRLKSQKQSSILDFVDKRSNATE
ncbi:tigger transposable element-derived protein 6-like [Montipora foliosa]|uniref:tigger transposable element-derived protein 6-like n=1 Tax=Montipora foliosa TaxID=591990 RepID=UPI0035F15902